LDILDLKDEYNQTIVDLNEKIDYLEKEIELAKRNADKLTIELENQVNTIYTYLS
jgi:hypothetical protein